MSGINFPSIFNEIVKGVYEALLHPGMPTAAEPGADEAAFREMTAGPDLEYELQKIAPEVSVRVHRVLLAIAEKYTARIQPILRRSGYGELPPQCRIPAVPCLCPAGSGRDSAFHLPCPDGPAVRENGETAGAAHTG